MLDLGTIFGLLLVTAGSTLLGSVPVLFHRYLKDSSWHWFESFGGGVMVAASFFSLLFPSLAMLHEHNLSYWQAIQGFALGFIFIYGMNFVIKKLTQNAHHQRAILVVFAMGLHNIPEGMAVGVDVAALGWKEGLPLCVAIFIQNLPEGLVSSMSFLISGFSVPQSLLANAVTAVIEGGSALLGFSFVSLANFGLPFFLSFAAACMLTVVALEGLHKLRDHETADFSAWGFGTGLVLASALDFLL
jgi:ZIP family zinc transporter